MKIAFSTLGCPEWSWEEMLVTAKDLGFHGIEIRGIENELHVPKTKPFSPEKTAATVERLQKLGLEVPCLTSACYLFDQSNIEAHLKEGREYIDLAAKIGVPFVRVLGDANPQPGTGIDLVFVAKNLKALADYAEGKKVMVLIETNGVLSDSKKLLAMLEEVNSSNAGVLWDVHHPYRYAGESVEETYRNLKKYIRYIHIKDSILTDGKIKYKMMGTGDVPVKQALTLLKENGFDGYVSLEWVKRWCIDLEEPGIVFSHFVNYVRPLL